MKRIVQRRHPRSAVQIWAQFGLICKLDCQRSGKQRQSPGLLNEGRKSGQAPGVKLGMVVASPSKVGKQADVAMLLRDKALHHYVRQAASSRPWHKSVWTRCSFW